MEKEYRPIEAAADTARQVLADMGVSCPNGLIPEADPISGQSSNDPATFFVDSEGIHSRMIAQEKTVIAVTVKKSSGHGSSSGHVPYPML